VVNAYLLILCVLILAGGRPGDRLGSRRLFIVGTAIFGAAQLFAPAALESNGSRRGNNVAEDRRNPRSYCLNVQCEDDGWRFDRRSM
jgi:hypothetical protein